MIAVGPLIFGASILVGAVLVNFFLDTVDELEDGARLAAGPGTADLLPAVQVRSLVAYVDADLTSSGLDRVELVIHPTAAPEGFPLRDLVVMLQTGPAEATYTLQGSSQRFAWAPLLDADPPVDRRDPVLTRGDLVRLTLPVQRSGLELAPRDEGHLLLLTPDGASVKVPFRIPASLDGRRVLELHSGAPEEAGSEPADAAGPEPASGSDDVQRSPEEPSQARQAGPTEREASERPGDAGAAGDDEGAASPEGADPGASERDADPSAAGP